MGILTVPPGCVREGWVWTRKFHPWQPIRNPSIPPVSEGPSKDPRLPLLSSNKMSLLLPKGLVPGGLVESQDFHHHPRVKRLSLQWHYGKLPRELQLPWPLSINKESPASPLSEKFGLPLLSGRNKNNTLLNRVVSQKVS
jgi:hypothetical protein